MSGPFDASYYEDLRGRVRGVLIAIADAFPTQEVGLIDDLIDANESGVAIEMIVGMLSEARVRVARTVLDQLMALVTYMDLSEETRAKVKELEST